MRRVLVVLVLVSLCVLLPGAATAQEKELPKPGKGPDGPSQCTGVPGNLVANCGFETGDFTDWQQFGDLSFTGVAGGAIAHSGAFGAFMGPVTDNGYLTQTLATPVGASCSMSFWLRNDGAPNRFEVWWGDTSLVYNIVNYGNFAYREVKFPLPATTAASTNLWIGFFNIPSFFWLDDIVVTCP